MDATYVINARIWKYPGFGGWHFITVRKGIAKEIRKLMTGRTRGFGSIRVEARVRKSVWKTSIFPTDEGTYLLPIKAYVRDKEGLETGNVVRVELRL